MLHVKAVWLRLLCDSSGLVPWESLAAVLELLQWRQGIQQETVLARPLCTLLDRLLNIATDMPNGDPEGTSRQDAEPMSTSSMPAAEAAFLTQLVLAGLRAVSERADAAALVEVCPSLPNISPASRSISSLSSG